MRIRGLRNSLGCFSHVKNIDLHYITEKKEKAWERKDVFSLDLQTVTESLSMTVVGSEFQTAGAEHR